MDKGNKFYFIGIGGIGMSSIAQYLVANNFIVGGYDLTKTDITKNLEKIGVEINYKDELKSIPSSFKYKSVVVIFTPAISLKNKQLFFFNKQGNQIFKRAEFLGYLTNKFKTIAIAGTHGKTTTAAIVTHLFYKTQQSFTAFVGGILNEFNSNIIITGNKYAVVEADEYDRSFLNLNPSIGLITSIDSDHLDIYGSFGEVKKSFNQFIRKVKNKVIVNKDLGINGITYSLNKKADYSANNISFSKTGYFFDLTTPSNTYKSVFFSQLGLHNLLNAIGAFAISSQVGINEKELCKCLSTFKGVKRRFQLVLNSKNDIIIDDYAHHPNEINAVWNALEDHFPYEKKCVIFQPHLYSRTKDFMNEFATALSKFDRVVLLPIYPARELPIKGIESSVLQRKIKSKNIVELVKRENLLSVMNNFPEKVKVILGAGDIGLEIQKIKVKLK
ncbi:MAG: UDP-N-acetylmuramate--L-alanine ligase [Flavobacteriaceae bacterium TMED200]|nr:UDP-N-acetylmuramate--L-alanine ligase [Flavobacteriaceae bacterium]OUW66636.1 MAG: UDP-N-acetylmuramate--L-alanine ligase [Flavobacteriaceae bacterium TMED200]|tara:strand:- start:14641 stop:15972 length:1332 start_codon:yes stop_codon:yes gene_type:complete